MKTRHTCPAILIFLCAFAVDSPPLLASQPGAIKGEDQDPHEWIVDSYQFPASGLATGFGSVFDKELKAPQLPGINATEDEILTFMRESDRISHLYPEIRDLKFPAGSLVLFNPETRMLTARLPRSVHASLENATDRHREQPPKLLELTLVLIEAPGDVVRSLLEKRSTGMDHTLFLEALLDEVHNGKAKILYRNRAESKSGERVKLEPVKEQAVAFPYQIRPGKSLEFHTYTIADGVSYEFDPVIYMDYRTIDLNSGLRYSYSSPRQRQLPEIVFGGVRLPGILTDTFSAEILTQYSITTDTPRILGVWRPEFATPELQPTGNLQVAIVTPKVIGTTKIVDTRLTEFIEKYGERVKPIPKPPEIEDDTKSNVSDGMILRRYSVSHMLVSTPVTDPFASTPSPATSRFTVQESLKKAGIEFPEGSFANYIPSTFTLVVQNTRDQLDLIEAYIGAGCNISLESGMAFTFHIVEGPTAEIEKALDHTSGQIDHTEEWNRLQKRDDVRVVASYQLEARSGQRGRIVSACKFLFPFIAFTDPDKQRPNSSQGGDENDSSTEKTQMICRFEEELVGTSIEVDPVLGADNFTIDLNVTFEHDFAPPTIFSRNAGAPEPIELNDLVTEFHQAKIKFQSVVYDGTMRMAGSWRPNGLPQYENTDVKHAVFLKVDVLPLDE